MLRRIQDQIARVRSLRLDSASVGQAGLAFLLAYAIAYVIQTV